MPAIGYRDSRYLLTTLSGRGSEYLEWDCNSNAAWKSKGPCKVETERFGEWSPMTESTEPKVAPHPPDDGAQ